MTAIAEVTQKHPCFSVDRPNNKGRIHLPVSPGCNIECKFCDRKINTTEQCPGVTAQVISPLEALEVVRKSLALLPEITVVGIAGPGEALATPYALETFRLIGKEFPALIRCMSTNGLLLDDLADEVINAGVNTLTVTVNEIYPAEQARICARIRYKDKVYEGTDAARLLISKQLAGIRRIKAAGILVKVNTVLVPGINDGHIADIARTVSEAGADLYNIIPLIPRHEMSNAAPPACFQIDKARVEAEKYIRVFRHCQHCRADAVGVPGGKDYGERIYLNRVSHSATFSHG
ncbi:MAG: radical SAM protein [Treponema sp.]|jgi:nitrogen fixation protein NifB|nr:radical SAM protein [Treponema sp.]